MGMHPRKEHLLGVIYKKGLQVQLVRCGPAYTGSTNNWYSLKSAQTHPVMLQQSIRMKETRCRTVTSSAWTTPCRRAIRETGPGCG